MADGLLLTNNFGKISTYFPRSKLVCRCGYLKIILNLKAISFVVRLEVGKIMTVERKIVGNFVVFSLTYFVCQQVKQTVSESHHHHFPIRWTEVYKSVWDFQEFFCRYVSILIAGGLLNLVVFGHHRQLNILRNIVQILEHF